MAGNGGGSSKPDDVFEEILGRKLRKDAERRLRAVHEMCRQEFEVGQAGLTVANIANRLVQRKLLENAKSIYNVSAKVYVELIEAWAAHAGPAPPMGPKAHERYKFLEKITDPSVRYAMQAIASERDKFKGQLSVLKGQTQLIVDLRPTAPAEGQIAARPRLATHEVEAIRHACSPKFHKQQGWKEIDLGEVVNAQGRTIFQPGFLTGLKKVLKLVED